MTLLRDALNAYMHQTQNQIAGAIGIPPVMTGFFKPGTLVHDAHGRLYRMGPNGWTDADGDEWYLGVDPDVRRSVNAAVRGLMSITGALSDWPDPDAPQELGWRCWAWDQHRKRLVSPHQNTVWEDSELRCEHWDEGAVVRGASGIHARRVPLGWERAVGSEVQPAMCQAIYMAGAEPTFQNVRITGLVERFGKFVQGTEGWRAEHVIIKKLCAPCVEIGMELERAYPDVEIVYADR